MFRLTVECSELGRVKMDATLQQFRGNTAQFVCTCDECRDNHFVSRKASPGTMRTPQSSEGPRKLVPIQGYPFGISVPCSMMHMMIDGFDLGRIHFTYKRKGYSEVIALVPDKPLPESWLVDIGQSYEVLG